MDKTFEGQSLTKLQIGMLIIFGGFIGAILVFFIQRAISDDWMLVEASSTINMLLLYGIGLFLSTWYFIRDYVMYDGLTLTMTNGKMQFIRKDGKSSEFGFLELKNFKDMKLFYRMFGLVKVTIQIKSSQDFRRYQKVILLKEDEMTEFLKALDDNVKKAQAHKSKRIEPKT